MEEQGNKTLFVEVRGFIQLLDLRDLTIEGSLKLCKGPTTFDWTTAKVYPGFHPILEAPDEEEESSRLETVKEENVIFEQSMASEHTMGHHDQLEIKRDRFESGKDNIEEEENS